MTWRNSREFMRSHVNSYLGIASVESSRLSKGEHDRVFRLTLQQLAELVEKMQIDLQHLQSRHDYLKAVVKAGPYAVISSLVGLVWALVAQEWIAAIPVSAISAIVVTVVIACNRLGTEVEVELAVRRGDLVKVEERHRIREEEVKADVQKAKGKASDIFDDYFRFSFSKGFFDQHRKQLQLVLPDPDSPRYANMKYRHNKCFEYASDLKEKTKSCIDAADAWRTLIEEKMTSVQPNPPHLSPGDKEMLVDNISRSVIYCISENIVKQSQVDAMERQGRIPSSYIQEIARILKPPFVSLLTDKDLRVKATELEKLRADGEELRRSLLREVSVLYG